MNCISEFKGGIDIRCLPGTDDQRAVSREAGDERRAGKSESTDDLNSFMQKREKFLRAAKVQSI